MPVLGIDPSLNSTGYAYEGDNGVVTGVIAPKNMRNCERLSYIRDCVSDLLRRVEPKLVVMEDYAMAARNSRAFASGEGGGIIRLAIHDFGSKLLVVPPKSLKLFATGNGNADKLHVQACIANRWKRKIDQNDMADAFVCYKFGRAVLYKRERRRYDSRSRKALDAATEY